MTGHDAALLDVLWSVMNGPKADPGLHVFDTVRPTAELIAAWEALDDSTPITLSKGEMTRLLNFMTNVLIAVSEGQVADYWAVHKKMEEANKSAEKYRDALKEAQRNQGEFTKDVMSKLTAAQ